MVRHAVSSYRARCRAFRGRLAVWRDPLAALGVNDLEVDHWQRGHDALAAILRAAIEPDTGATFYA